MGKPTMEPKHKVVRVRISEEMLKKLQNKAENSGWNVSEVVREALRKYLEKD